MRSMIIAAAAAGAALTLGSCATMSEEQCLAGDWSGQGYADGASGMAQSRLGEHAQACVKHGVTPDDAAYQSGWSQGVTTYCTRDRGFEAGRSGSTYAGVCPADLEADFLPAYQDGQMIYRAETAVSDARSRVDSLGNRLEELDDKITAKQAEARADGLTDEQREQIRNRIQEIRRERADTERDWRRAQADIDDAEEALRDVRWRLRREYNL